MAILKGEVKNFKENNNYSVYGPTHILKYSIPADFFIHYLAIFELILLHIFK